MWSTSAPSIADFQEIFSPLPKSVTEKRWGCFLIHLNVALKFSQEVQL